MQSTILKIALIIAVCLIVLSVSFYANAHGSNLPVTEREFIEYRQHAAQHEIANRFTMPIVVLMGIALPVSVIAAFFMFGYEKHVFGVNRVWRNWGGLSLALFVFADVNAALAVLPQVLYDAFIDPVYILTALATMAIASANGSTFLAAFYYSRRNLQGK